MAAKIIIVVVIKSMEEEGYHLMVDAACVARNEDFKDIIIAHSKKEE